METTTAKTLTIKADPARRRFRDMLDSAIRGVPVVIERYDRPEAVLVGYERWRVLESAFVAMLKQRSQEMDDGQQLTQEQFDAALHADMLDRLSAEVDAGNVHTQEKVEAGLHKLGLID